MKPTKSTMLDETILNVLCYRYSTKGTMLKEPSKGTTLYVHY